MPHDVLDAAGPGFDRARRTDRLRFLLAATGADGHHVLLSRAEIDLDFELAPVPARREHRGRFPRPGGPRCPYSGSLRLEHTGGIDVIRVDGRCASRE
ncbi:hypothetical protein [Streptomyces sp. B1I3]|uniref:hypothetical protein n=1 Tax=Streptomyces sp. B1I3 TaxID=3042264 RepID=UPI002786AAE6|nr:hypothetical protein [Streptomyces sp. B1I3]MDQ0792393.1 hypothetical protein [Streptomyces sp. B1I3]